MDQWPQQEIQTFQAIQIENYVNAACASLWLFDHACTFIPEVSLIWKAPWNIPKVLYILTKYLPFFTLGVLFYYHNPSSDFSMNQCLASEKFITWMINISMCVAEMIFTIRTWAVWGRTRRMAVFLSIFSVVIWLPVFAFMGLWVATLTPDSTLAQLIPHICYCTTASSFVPANYAFIILSYVVTLSLMSIKAYQQGTLNKLSKLVYVDGILYYFYLFSFSIINLAIDLALPNRYQNLLSKPQQILCSILACRLVLHLRECGRQSMHMNGTSRLSAACLDTLMYQDFEQESDLQTLDGAF